MSKIIMFSVLVCVYEKDSPDCFRTAIESILNQTVPPNEVVLVVDGIVPDSINLVIKGYEGNEKITVIRLPKNQGHGNARRVGLQHCQYDLVALMDSDDISVPDRFERQLTMFLVEPTLSVVGGNIVEFIGSITNIVGARNVPQSNADIKQYLRKRCPMNQVTVMFKKSDIDKVGGYIDWYCEEDYYLWIRLFLAKAEFANINETLVYVRVGKEMYQRRGGWRYFMSEVRLQRYMLKNEIISFPLYFENIIKRFFVQILLPNRIRSWVYQRYAREKA